MRRITLAALLILSANASAASSGSNDPPRDGGISLTCMLRTCSSN